MELPLEEEVRHLREALQSKTERLNKADEALRFYSNPKSYGFTEKILEREVHQNVLKNDFTVLVNSPMTYVAGRRARDYFKTYGEEVI